jgi:hypothetical protein
MAGACDHGSRVGPRPRELAASVDPPRFVPPRY